MDRAPDGQPATQAPQAMHLDDLPVSGLTVAYARGRPRGSAAADALVRVDDARAAAKAARGLLFDLLFGKRDALVAKRPAQRLVIADALARRCVVIDGDQSVLLVELDKLAAVASIVSVARWTKRCSEIAPSLPAAMASMANF